MHPVGALDDDDRVQPAHVLEAVPRGAPAPQGLDGQMGGRQGVFEMELSEG